MKELLRLILLIVSIVAFCYLAPAQHVPQPYRTGDHVQQKASLELREQEELIWYEDFAGGLPGEWQSTSSNGFCAFQHTYNGPQGPFSVGMPPLNSQSAANGFMILDSDLCSSQNPGGVTDAFLQSPPIDLSGYEKVMLRFQHNFRYCCSPSAVEMVVEVSTDGQSWTSFDVRNGLSPNNTSANPVNQAVNISDVAAGNPQVWIRFRKTGATHYWWMIDDVSLVSFVENDLQITGVKFNKGYTMVPAGQQQVADFSASVRNAGGFPQNDVSLEVTINRLLFQAQSATIAVMQPGQERNFSITDAFVAPAKGLYQAELLVSQLQSDQNPETNRAIVSFLINDTVYARTYPGYDEGLYIPLGQGGYSAAANAFGIVEPTEATSVSFALNEASPVGAQVKVALYFIGQGDYMLLAQSQSYMVAMEDITQPGSDDVVLVTLAFDQGVDLSPGNYLAVVELAEEGQSLLLAAKNDLHQPSGAVWLGDGSQWMEAETTPMIQLNLGNNFVECEPQYAFITQSSLCGNANGSIEVVPLTGVGPFAYVWSDDAQETGSLRENIAAGVYEVTVTDGYGCVVDLSVELLDEEIGLSFVVEDALCSAGGEILIEPLNGQEPFVYSWSHDSSLTGPLAENLAPGSYTVIATDVNDCSAQITVVVGNSNILPVEVQVIPAFCGSATGSIELIPQAGSEPYSFSWTNHPDASGPLLENLTPGNYAFTVADQAGCTFNGTAVITSQDYTLNLQADVSQPSCGINNGAISIAVANGQSPFAYSWSVGIGEPQVENLAPGTYVLTVTDHYGCATTQTFTLVNAGAMPQVEWTTTHSPNCGESNGSISITPLNAGDEYTYTVLTKMQPMDDDNGDPGNDAAFTLEGLPAGLYLISVVNQEGCEQILSLAISDLGAPAINGTVENISCYGANDGAIEVVLEGATDPQYLWDDEGNSTTPSLTGLGKGTYTLFVIDQGCQAVASFQITEPALLLANATVNHIVCGNHDQGSILLTIQGGTGPFTYIWNTGFSGRDLVDVPAGTYTVLVTDYQYCTFQQSYTITANAPIQTEAVVVHASPGAANGSINVNVSGGVAPYTYVWEHGPQGSVIFGLVPGVYTLTITDQAGCQVVESFTLGTVNIIEAQTADWKLYPNPASDALYVDVSGMCENQPIRFEVYNITGSRMLQLDATAAPDPVKIELGSLPRGVYLLKASCRERTLQRKFVKH